MLPNFQQVYINLHTECHLIGPCAVCCLLPSLQMPPLTENKVLHYPKILRAVELYLLKEPRARVRVRTCIIQTPIYRPHIYCVDQKFPMMQYFSLLPSWIHSHY